MNTDYAGAALIAFATVGSMIYLICIIVYNDFILPMRQRKKETEQNARMKRIVDSMNKHEVINVQLQRIENKNTGEVRSIEDIK